jgi:hypothetical protein
MYARRVSLSVGSAHGPQLLHACPCDTSSAACFCIQATSLYFDVAFALYIDRTTLTKQSHMRDDLRTCQRSKS